MDFHGLKSSRGPSRNGVLETAGHHQPPTVKMLRHSPRHLLHLLLWTSPSLFLQPVSGLECYLYMAWNIDGSDIATPAADCAAVEGKAQYLHHFAPGTADFTPPCKYPITCESGETSCFRASGAFTNISGSQVWAGCADGVRGIEAPYYAECSGDKCNGSSGRPARVSLPSLLLAILSSVALLLCVPLG